MKIYTRTGDSGSTGLFGGPRVSKDDERIEAYGTVDELNAALGAARGAGVPDVIDGELEQIQHELFSIGAELASPDPDAHQLRIIGPGHIERLEGWIDDHERGLAPLKHFVLPAGAVSAAQLHMARAVCRRAERRVVTLAGRPDGGCPDGSRPDAGVSESVLVYLNRLSDLLFVMARAANVAAGAEEVRWVRPG